LTIIALEQDGLLKTPSNVTMGTGKLNEYVLRANSSFIETVDSNFGSSNWNERGEALITDDRVVWQTLQLKKIVGFHKPELDKAICEHLKSGSFNNSTIVGLLLSIYSVIDHDKLRQDYGKEDLVKRCLNEISKNITTFVKDHQFLQGLEAVLQTLST
jgi:hypothetical protein